MNGKQTGGHVLWYCVSALITAVLVVACVWCFLPIADLHGDFKSFLENTAPLMVDNGDSASGIAAVYVGIVTALITFIAFLIPFFSSLIQHRRHSENRSDIAQERFENKFYFYLESYTAIVNNIEIINVCKGHHSFNYMFYELQTIFYIISDLHIKSLSGEDLSDEQVIDISVSISVNGFTPLSTGGEYDIIYSKCKNMISLESYYRIRDKILSYKDMNNERLKELLNANKYTFFSNFARFQLADDKRVYWFRGKRSDLIPYFKLIKTAFDFIESRYPSGQKNTGTDKNYYLDLLNSQMSDHELALLYSFAHSGENTIGINRKYVEHMVKSSKMPELYNFNNWSKLNPNK